MSSNAAGPAAMTAVQIPTRPGVSKTANIVFASSDTVFLHNLWVAVVLYQMVTICLSKIVMMHVVAHKQQQQQQQQQHNCMHEG